MLASEEADVLAPARESDAVDGDSDDSEAVDLHSDADVNIPLAHGSDDIRILDQLADGRDDNDGDDNDDDDDVLIDQLVDLTDEPADEQSETLDEVGQPVVQEATAAVSQGDFQTPPLQALKSRAGANVKRRRLEDDKVENTVVRHESVRT
jgi:hypothetical protein